MMFNREMKVYTEEELLEGVPEDEMWRGTVPFLVANGMGGFAWERHSNRVGYPQPETPARFIEPLLYHQRHSNARLLWTPEYMRFALTHYGRDMTHHMFLYEEVQTIGDFLYNNDQKWLARKVFLEDDLRWSTHEGPLRVSCYRSPEKREQGVRTRVKLETYLTRIMEDGSVKPHQLRDMAALVYSSRQDDGQFEVHRAKNAREIIDIYEKANFGSCMSRSMGSYLQVDNNDDHPVQVYDSPDIEVLGLWDTQQELYVARTVTNKHTLEFSTIYPSDETGMRGMMNNRLRNWLHSQGYSQKWNALMGARIRRIDYPEGDGYLLPYIDADEPMAIMPSLRTEKFGIIAPYGAPTGDYMSCSCETFAAQPTRGWVNDEDRYNNDQEEDDGW